MRLIDSLAIRRADRVVALTGTFRDWLDRDGLKPRDTVAVIPDAYDDTRWQPRDRAAARIALGLPANAFVVTYSGLTFAYRGLDQLVRAFARLRERCPRVSCSWSAGAMGSGPNWRRWRANWGSRRRCASPASARRTRWWTILAAADALVIQGTVSGLNASPLKLFEYAAMDRPIVAGDIPAVREILGDDGAAYFPQATTRPSAPPCSPLQRDPAAATAMAARARARVQPFTYRARAARFSRWRGSWADPRAAKRRSMRREGRDTG